MEPLSFAPLHRRGFLKLAGLAGATWLTPISHLLA
ncbi:MAG: twin-arginine translocation signal domain-containing protein, partial [Candidatus Acidiferrum sp.]